MERKKGDGRGRHADRICGVKKAVNRQKDFKIGWKHVTGPAGK